MTSNEHWAVSAEGTALMEHYEAWRAVVETMRVHGLTEQVREHVVDGQSAQRAGVAAVGVIHEFIVRSVGERIPGMDEQARELVAELMAAGLLHGQTGVPEL